jgi:predicted DNA-binding protein with PD1-like motif
LKTILIFSFLFSTIVSAQTSKMNVHVLRLRPGQDVMKEITDYTSVHKILAGSILSAVGSLNEAYLRFANNKEGSRMKGPFEVVSLSGTIGMEGSHLHMALADGKGITLGGHLLEGNKVFTTLEIVLAEYPDLNFKRTLDVTYGYKELDVQKK